MNSLKTKICFSLENNLIISEQEVNKIIKRDNKRGEMMISNEINYICPEISGQIILLIEKPTSFFSIAKFSELFLLKMTFPNDHPVSLNKELFKETQIKFIPSNEETIALAYSLTENSFLTKNSFNNIYNRRKEYYESQTFEILSDISTKKK